MKKGGVSEINGFISMTNTNQNRFPGTKSSVLRRVPADNARTSIAKQKSSSESKSNTTYGSLDDKIKSLPGKPSVRQPLVRTSTLSKGSRLTTGARENEKPARPTGVGRNTTATTSQKKPNKSRILTQRTTMDDVYRKGSILLSRAHPNSAATMSNVVPSSVDKLPAQLADEKTNISDDDLEYEYEDDFEDYKSDFESYTPSAESTSDVDDEEPENTKIFVEEEKKMDSGSYHVTYQQQTPKQITQLAIIREALQNENKLVQQSIELNPSSDFPLFNEPFASEKTEKPSSLLLDFDASSMKNFTNMKKRHRDSKILKKMKIRGEKLLQMVTLDTMSFTLFDSPSIPYDIFMKSYARKNTIQVFTQTNEDGVSTEMQTEEILYESKWTQHPVEITKNQLTDDVNPFELLSGVGGSSKQTNPPQPEIKIQRLISFMKSVGEEMIAFLEETSGNDLHGDNDGTNTFDTAVSECIFNVKCNCFEFMSRYSTTKLRYDRNNAFRILTVHEEMNNEAMTERGVYFICVWNIRQPSKPKSILRGYGRASCCSFVGDDCNNFVVAGNEDGSICMWNLREEFSSLHTDKLPTLNGGISVKLPCYTTIGTPILGAHNGRILNIDEIKVTAQNDPYNSKSRMIYSVDDENTLIVWTFATNFRTREEELTFSNKPRFFISQTIDVARKNRGHSFLSTTSKLLSDCDILVGTDIGIVIRCNLYGKKSKIFKYSYEDSEKKLGVTCIEVCPCNRECFAVSYDNGVVNLFDVRYSNCTRSVSSFDSLSTGINSVQWLWNEPHCILTFNYSSEINIYRVDSQHSPLIQRITRSGTKSVEVSPTDDSNSCSKTLHFNYDRMARVVSQSQVFRRPPLRVQPSAQ